MDLSRRALFAIVLALLTLAVACAPAPTPTPLPTATQVPPTATLVPPTATQPPPTPPASPVRLIWKTTGAPERLEGPGSIAIDPQGYLYVLDAKADNISKFDGDAKFLLKWGGKGDGDGQFFFGDDAGAIAVDRAGNVYVADVLNDRIQKFDSNGKFLLKWGSHGAGDGQFNHPVGVGVDQSGNVYVADARKVRLGETIEANNRIQKFDANGRFLAKWGSQGAGDGQFNGAGDLAIDARGNVFVTDQSLGRVVKFDRAGKFVTAWNTCGSAEPTQMNVGGLGVDRQGNVYVTHLYRRVCLFDNHGKYLTQWGTAGDGDLQFRNPTDVAVDAQGNIYVVDHASNTVKKFALTTVAPTPALAQTPEPYSNFGVWLRDVTYCNPDGLALKMDIYLPKQRKRDPTPALIYLHANSSRKQAVNPLIEFLVAGYVVASADFRDAPDYKSPAAVADAKCAVRFLRAHAAALRLDPNSVGAYGYSYGGYLAAMLAVTDASAGLEGTGEYLEQSSRVQAVAPMAGVYDLKAMLESGAVGDVEENLGVRDPQAPLVARFSPVTYVSKDAPPFLILHGDSDAVVPFSQAQEMHDKSKAAGAPATLVVLENTSHRLALKPEHVKMMIDFFDRALK